MAKSYTVSFEGEFIIDAPSELEARMKSKQFLDMMSELLEEYKCYILKLEGDIQQDFSDEDEDDEYGY